MQVVNSFLNQLSINLDEKFSIAKVITINPEGDMNLYTKVNGSLANSC